MTALIALTISGLAEQEEVALAAAVADLAAAANGHDIHVSAHALHDPGGWDAEPLGDDVVELLAAVSYATRASAVIAYLDSDAGSPGARLDAAVNTAFTLAVRNAILTPTPGARQRLEAGVVTRFGDETPTTCGAGHHITPSRCARRPGHTDHHHDGAGWSWSDPEPAPTTEETT